MILDEIVFTKQQEVTVLKSRFHGQDLAGLIKQLPQPRDFLGAFRPGKLSLIAEIKRASPSAGALRPDLKPAFLAQTYEESGAAALSVLTDERYFQGKLADLKAAKDSTTIPVLRKDFIIDETQVYEARLGGADALLLIVRILEDEQLKGLLQLAESLGLQALVEAHSAAEVERALAAGGRLVGINNRDLDTLKIDLNSTLDLIQKFPELKNRIVISESGIKSREDILKLAKAGVNGVLIGETLLKSDNIPARIKELMG